MTSLERSQVSVSGDKHLGLVSDGVSRLDEQRRVLEFVVEMAKGTVHVDLGDLFDVPRPSPATYALAFEYVSALAEACEEVHLLVGNHDRPSVGVWTAHDPIDAVSGQWKNVYVHREPAYFVRSPYSLLMLPYLTDSVARSLGHANARDALERSSEMLLDHYAVKRKDFVAFAHLDVAGSIRNAHDSRQREVGLEVPKSVVERAARVYCGHVHRPQRLSNEVVVVGSAVHVDFGEADDTKVMYDGDGDAHVLPVDRLVEVALEVGPEDTVDGVLADDLTDVNDAHVKPVLFVPEDALMTVDRDRVVAHFERRGAKRVRRPTVNVVRRTDERRDERHATTLSAEESLRIFADETDVADAEGHVSLAMELIRVADVGDENDLDG